MELASATLDIAILNAGPQRPAIVYARCDSDVALANLPAGAKLKTLLAFRNRINSVLLSNLPRPTKKELTQFGYSLFNYIVRDDVKILYNRLPLNHLVRIHILTNRPDLQSLPWEYLQDPQQAPGPWKDRSIIRIVPTIGRAPFKPLPLNGGGQKIRILFAYADPADQTLVNWPNVRKNIEQVFSLRLSGNYDLKVIEGTPLELVNAFQNNNDQYEIFQFSGHGDIDPQTGEGRLLLLNKAKDISLPFSASTLAMLLSGRGIRLAVLSACLTAAGNAAEPFNIIAEALVLGGIPAVVANQLPVPDSSVATFVGPLYTQLLNTGDIDLAVNEGRVSLAANLPVGPAAALEWGIPTLYRHIGSPTIFEPLAPLLAVR